VRRGEGYGGAQLIAAFVGTVGGAVPALVVRWAFMEAFEAARGRQVRGEEGIWSERAAAARGIGIGDHVGTASRSRVNC